MAMIDIAPARGVRNRGLASLAIPAKRSLPFAESDSGRYTHRVRHVTHYSLLGKCHIAVRCWCGYTVLISKRKRGRLCEEPGSGRPVCATCEGRAIGAGLLGAREIAGRPVMYQTNETREGGV